MKRAQEIFSDSLYDGDMVSKDVHFSHSRSDEHPACLTLFGSAFSSYFGAFGDFSTAKKPLLFFQTCSKLASE